jgi:MFS family permease
MHPGQSPALDKDHFERVIQGEHRDIPRRAQSLDLLVPVGGQKIQVAPLRRPGLFRGVALFFLPFVTTVPGLYAFAALFGLNFISTVPATTTLTARIYGRYSVGELSGWIFASHQLGGATGSIVSGWIFDRSGDYTLAFYAAAGWALLASIMVLAIRDEPLVRGKRGAPLIVPATSS